MPDATYYFQQSRVLRANASEAQEPAVAARLQTLADDYQWLATLLSGTGEERHEPPATDLANLEFWPAKLADQT